MQAVTHAAHTQAFGDIRLQTVANHEFGGTQIPAAYLTHGVAKDKWDERGRFKVFKDFFEKLTDENAQWALINLSAEMAKVCRKEERQ